VGAWKSPRRLGWTTSGFFGGCRSRGQNGIAESRNRGGKKRARYRLAIGTIRKKSRGAITTGKASWREAGRKRFPVGRIGVEARKIREHGFHVWVVGLGDDKGLGGQGEP